LTKNEYIDWKSSPATQEVFDDLARRVEGLKDELAGSAGEDPRADAWRVGAIQAYRDILATTYEEVNQDD
jgi:hypothetical protein